MLRQDLKDIKGWTEESPDQGEARRLSYLIAEGLQPLAERLWAEVVMLAEANERQIWKGRILLQDGVDGMVRPVADDSGETTFTGATFRSVTIEIVDALEGFVDDLQGAIVSLSALIDPPVLTVSDVAEELRTPRNTVLNWIKTGRLKAFRIGKKWQIRREHLQEALDNAIRSGTAPAD